MYIPNWIDELGVYWFSSAQYSYPRRLTGVELYLMGKGGTRITRRGCKGSWNEHHEMGSSA